jgi:hypothetical protein
MSDYSETRKRQICVRVEYGTQGNEKTCMELSKWIFLQKKCGVWYFCSWNLQNEYFRAFSIPSGDLSKPLFVQDYALKKSSLFFLPCLSLSLFGFPCLCVPIKSSFPSNLYLFSFVKLASFMLCLPAAGSVVTETECWLTSDIDLQPLLGADEVSVDVIVVVTTMCAVEDCVTITLIQTTPFFPPFF